MPIMTKRLGWSIIPLLALAFVSAAAANGRATGKASSVVGAAWHHDNTAIKSANLRLRNVVTGKILAIAKANDLGRFTFDSVEPGTYVVELVNDSGRVQAVSHVFMVAPGETVATFVRLDAHKSWAAAFFSSTAGAIVATAATEGITALAPLGRCASPPCS
jgi:hypothetical protein